VEHPLRRFTKIVNLASRSTFLVDLNLVELDRSAYFLWSGARFAESRVGGAVPNRPYVDIDLKIKDHHGQDKELSKGMLSICGIERRWLKRCVIESDSLATRLSTMDVLYGVMKDAVEGTIAIEVLRGDLHGKIIAPTTSIQNNIVLYNNQVVGGMAGDGTRAMKLMRSVVSAYVKDKLIIAAETSDGKSKRTIDFTPKISNREE
jgi:hypothetical protein